MTEDQAKQIIAYLNACFPRDALELETAAIWIKDLALLADPLIGRKAAETIAHSADAFPTIHQFRQTYRATAKAQEVARPAIGQRPAEPPRELPTWVRVWKWARLNGDERWFPQQVDKAPTRPSMTHLEYDELEQVWISAGRPNVRHAALDGQS